MKTYSEIRTANRDVVFLINDSGITFKMIMRYDAFSVDHFFGLELQVYNQSFGYIKNNAWILCLDEENIEEALRFNQFLKVEPTPLQSLLYGGDITANQN